MKKIIGVDFNEVGKIYWFNPGHLTINIGTKVVVETVRGLELATAVTPIKEVEDSEVQYELKDIVRVADPKDVKQYEENLEKAKKSLTKVASIINDYKLEMKLLGCEYTLDGTKLLIYYNAEGRVDFRELVKALASEFKVRIELRQIGPREGAKILGAIGTCGREVCCKNHIREFDLVTMKMAKEQGMALSSSKIAGVCGKLMCCIAYEDELYKEFKKEFPALNSYVKLKSGDSGKVISLDYIKRTLRIQSTPDSMPISCVLDDVVEIKGKNNNNETGSN